MFVARWPFWPPLLLAWAPFLASLWPLGAQNGSKKRPKSFRKSLKLHCLSPGGNFGTLWLFRGSIFARLGALSGFITVAGDVVFVQFYQIGCIFGLPWSLSLQIPLHFNLVVCGNARTCSSTLKSKLSNIISPKKFSNLSITKDYFHLECKQTSSGNKVPTSTRVNEGVGGIREAQTILGPLG